MASLKEIKGRIASVRSTLKITSAMKMVASAKLHKSQVAAERCAEYEAELEKVLKATSPSLLPAPHAEGKIAVVAVSSNSSLCGGFNTNVIKYAKSRLETFGKENCVVFAVGKKMADALTKEGWTLEGEWSDLIQHPSYESSALLAQSLIDGFNGGSFSRVVLIWSHFVSTSTQRPCDEDLLPITIDRSEEDEPTFFDNDYIVEPDPARLYPILLPKVLKLKVYRTLLDSAAAEHAARTVAMQTATDNGEQILSNLTLEYNKGRQSKITAEILDLAGGAQND